MEIVFEKKGSAWVSEFQVTSDFNLHIEREGNGRFNVYQKGVAEGKYDLVEDLGYQDPKRVIDLDFTALVYPKYIKVVSEAEVILGVVTFNA